MSTEERERMQPILTPPVLPTKRGPNHVLHFILTVATGGLWLPVWIIIALQDYQAKRDG